MCARFSRRHGTLIDRGSVFRAPARAFCERTPAVVVALRARVRSAANARGQRCATPNVRSASERRSRRFDRVGWLEGESAFGLERPRPALRSAGERPRSALRYAKRPFCERTRPRTSPRYAHATVLRAHAPADVAARHGRRARPTAAIPCIGLRRCDDSQSTSCRRALGRPGPTLHEAMISPAWPHTSPSSSVALLRCRSFAG